MSCLGDPPGLQRGKLGEGTFCPRKRRSGGGKRKGGKNGEGKSGGLGTIYTFFKPIEGKQRSGEDIARKAEDIPSRREKKLQKSSGRSPRGRRPKKTKKDRYRLTYHNEAPAKRRTSRRTQGEIPTFTVQEGQTSTLYGHSIEAIDNRETFRAIYQNPNGINPHSGNYQFALSLQECYDNCAAIIGLVETNREWKKQEQQRQLKEAIHKVWAASAVQTSTSEEVFTENYKPGGTVTIVVDEHWVCRIKERGEDPWGLGRWTYTILGGKGTKRVVSVQWYRVCQSSETNAGETTAYKQQFNILRERMEGKIDPRRQGTLDMQVWLTHLIRLGYEIILYLDGNEDITGKLGKWIELPEYEKGKHVTHKEHDGSIATLVITCGLVDIFATQHSGKIPPTYTRGTKRLDYVLVTPRVVESVERTTMLPFHTMFGGDHRPLLVDFNSRKLFGDDSYEIQRPQARGLKLTDPRLVDKYLDVLGKQLVYHRIYDKTERLRDISNEDKWTPQQVEQYEKIDEKITESDIYAERAISKRYSTKYEWSPELMRAVNEVRYWELRLKICKGIPVDAKTLRGLREAAKLPVQSSDGIIGRLAVVENLREARRQMYDFQRRHAELRRQYLADLAEAKLLQRRPWLNEDGYEQQLREQTEKQLRELVKREEVRRMHRTIRSILKPGQGQGLLQVEVPDTDAVPPKGTTFGNPKDGKTWKGPWKVIKEPNEMARRVAIDNIREYHQAHPTPFCNGILGQHLGQYADSKLADIILEGRDLPPDLLDGLMDETRRMLKSMGKPPPLVERVISLEITAADFQAMYKVVDEKISSSPSNKHVGHYKAATRSPALSQVYAIMMSLPYKEGFSPARWRVVLDVMLPKEENNWKIHRLRIIQLYESDVNQSMRFFFARQMGFLLEDSNCIPDMQFGSRPGKMSISPVLQKQLTYDIARHSKGVLGCVENDAIGCYNRTANKLGYLKLRQLGMPMSAIKSLADTWSQMVHVIRTAYGRSSSSYRSTKRKPLYGAGQGSTNGPFFWLLMFILMLDSFDPSLRALLFISVCAQLVASRKGDAFVDDSHLGVTSAYEDDPTLTMEDNTRLHELHVIEDLTKLAQHYERLLWSTGGALNILKCSWVMISWVWKHGRARLATIAQAPGVLSLTSGDSRQKETVPRLQPTEIYRTLGVFINGSNKRDKAKAILRGHSAAYAGKLGPAVINPATAFYAFQLYLSPKIGYALPVSMFTFQESNYIQAPALMVTLPKLKLNRNTARAIIHGPSDYGGLTIRHVYGEQGYGQLRLLLGHLRNKDHTGELIRISLSYLQLLVGSTKLALNLPYSKYAGWIESSWLTSVWAFLDRTSFAVDIRRAWTPPPQRAGDVALMTFFIESGYTKRDLVLLNQCRIYHQLFFLSDIATADGRRIEEIYKTSERNTARQSQWKWPRQGKPAKTTWTLWRNALSYFEQGTMIRETLGEWIAPSHQRWAWQVNLQDNEVRFYDGGQYQYFRPVARGPTRRAAMMYNITAPIRTGTEEEAGEWAAATPTFLVKGDDIFFVAKSGRLLQEAVATPTPEIGSCFMESLSFANPYFQRMLGPVSGITDATIEAIGVYIQEGSLLTCSDGSHEPETDSACQAWLFSDQYGHLLWSGAGPTDGNPDMLSSYRSELAGITTILFLLREITNYLEITTGSAILYCDNMGAVENVFEEYPKRGIYPLLERDYDLLGAARKLWRELPIKVTGTWVKGHFKGNDREIQHDLNDLADKLAEQFQMNPPSGYQTRRMPLLHPEHEATLYFEGSVMTTKQSSFRHIIYRQLFSTALRQNIMKKEGWTTAQFNKVSWEAYGAAFRAQTVFQQISASKLSHSLWNTGVQKRLFGQDPEGLCPVCLCEEETMDHVFQCRHESARAIRAAQLEALEEDLYILGTPMAAKESIMIGLNWWLLEYSVGTCPKAPGFGSVYGPKVWATAAYVDQSDIGWGQLLRGRPSKLWGAAFVKETTSTKPKESHLWWTKRFIRLLWKVAFAIWEHRNQALHGKNQAEHDLIQQQEINDTIEEVYQLYQQDTSIVSASAQSLFTRPKDQLLRCQKQYKLCWIRSVQVAIAYQQRETKRLQKQAARFFGPRKASAAPSQAAVPEQEEVELTPTREVPREDIATPRSYNLRHRRRQLDSDGDESDDSFILPPQMFEDLDESPYQWSRAQDIPLRSDGPISPEELEDILRGSSDSFTSKSSSDMLELSSHRTTSKATTICDSGGQPTLCRDEATVETSVSELTAPESEYADQQFIDELLVRTESIAPQDSGKALTSTSSVNSGSSSAASWQPPRFPLSAIGPVCPEPPMQNPARQAPAMDNITKQCQFLVLAEVRREDFLGSPLRLGQPSQEYAGSGSGSSEGGATQISEEEAQNILHLVNRAMRWLLQQTSRSMTHSGITPSIYWAVRSLPSFYARQIIVAEASGAGPLLRVAENEWPDEPDEQEGDGGSWDLSGLPEWLRYILLLDDVHESGLRDITGRRRSSVRAKRPEWFPAASLFVESIPERELDDPPDGQSEGSCEGGRIQEMSVLTIENNQIEDKTSC